MVLTIRQARGNSPSGVFLGTTCKLGAMNQTVSTVDKSLNGIPFSVYSSYDNDSYSGSDYSTATLTVTFTGTIKLNLE